MNRQNLVTSLHAEDLEGDYCPCRSGYPVMLLTRRVMGSYSNELLASRKNSPRNVSTAIYLTAHRRPPC